MWPRWGVNDRIIIRLIYDARADINPADMKLRHNVLSETADYVFG